MAIHTSLSEVGTEPQTELIINYALHMKKNGRAEITIQRTTRLLTKLSKSANLTNPEEVKTVLSNLKWKDTTKKMTAYTLKAFYEYLEVPYKLPQYKIKRELPFIPAEEELDLLIASGEPATATRLQILKETGARIGELDYLEWTHVDTQRGTIYITGEKGSNSRILPISNKLIAMLNHLSRQNDKVFQTCAHSLRTTFEALRKRTAIKLNNPRLKKIHFHTLRHWKGTTEYHKTKDIIHVKTVLGHRNIKSTMIYINIESALYLQASDEWTCKATTNDNEATQLIEAGFEYVMTTPNGLMQFRKRK